MDELEWWRDIRPFEEYPGEREFEKWRASRVIQRTGIDKQALTLEIINIIFRVFFQEMAIKSGDFTKIAQGDSELAQDLKELFCVSFNQGEIIAQEKLDAFCGKWKLDKIEIRNNPRAIYEARRRIARYAL